MQNNKSQLTKNETPRYGLRRAVAAVGLAATVASGVVLGEAGYHSLVHGAHVQEQFENNRPDQPSVQHQLNITENQIQQHNNANEGQTAITTEEQP